MLADDWPVEAACLEHISTGSWEATIEDTVEVSITVNYLYSIDLYFRGPSQECRVYVMWQKGGTRNLERCKVTPSDVKYLLHVNPILA